MVSPARSIATRVLERVIRDDAWATPALDSELARNPGRRDDAALATQVVYGTLRTLPELEQAIARHLQRPLTVDDWTRAALLGAAFQLRHLERVPPHAVVHDAVELVRMKRGKRLAGFVNAVLRKLASERPERPRPASSVVVPGWLYEALIESLGSTHTDDLLRVGRARPSIDLRVRRDHDRDDVANAVSAARPSATVVRSELSSFGLRVLGAGDPRLLPGYQEGAFAVQEEGAQLIGLITGASPGERVLDVCAGRGGKTTQLLEAVSPHGAVLATDLYEHRLDQIRGECDRLRLDSRGLETACVDWTRGKGGVEGQYDRVLVDAPCTGLGTLRRRPEILLRTRPDSAAQMGETQRAILERAARLVCPGGTLTYAVCSPLKEEGLVVAEGAQLPGFELVVGRASELKSLRFGSTGRMELGPWIEGAGPWADAYQVFMWVNVG